jgi:hypothetical protein
MLENRSEIYSLDTEILYVTYLKHSKTNSIKSISDLLPSDILIIKKMLFYIIKRCKNI